MNAPLELVRSTLIDTVNAHLHNDETYQLDIDALDLRIIIKGPTWTGIVDKPLAKFLLDFDRKISDELRRNGVVLPETTHGFIAIQVNEGSAELVIKSAKAVIDSLKKMSTKDKVITLVAILTALGMYATPAILKEANTVGLEKIRSEERVELVKTVAEIAQNSRELQQPLRGLISKIDDKDTIKLPSSEIPLNKKDAKQLLERGRRVAPEVYYIDQRYIVDGLTTKKSDGWEVTLRVGELSFTAKLMLSHEDATALLNAFQDAHAKGTDISPDLQVNARINDKGVQSAEVFSIGTPREKAMSLGAALEKASELSAPADDAVVTDK